MKYTETAKKTAHMFQSDMMAFVSKYIKRQILWKDSGLQTGILFHFQ